MRCNPDGGLWFAAAAARDTSGRAQSLRERRASVRADASHRGRRDAGKESLAHKWSRGKRRPARLDSCNLSGKTTRARTSYNLQNTVTDARVDSKVMLRARLEIICAPVQRESTSNAHKLSSASHFHSSCCGVLMSHWSCGCKLSRKGIGVKALTSISVASLSTAGSVAPIPVVLSIIWSGNSWNLEEKWHL